MSSQDNNRSKHEIRSTGSPHEGEPLYLVIGKFKRPHGIRGEILFDVVTDFPERIKKGKKVYVSEEHKEEEIAAVRSHQKGLLIKLTGKDTLEDLEHVRNKWVYVKAEDLPPLPDGEYYFHQLTNMKVYNEHGEYLGVIREVLETGANDVYLLETPEGKELLLPAIGDVIKKISVQDGIMIASPPVWY